MKEGLALQREAGGHALLPPFSLSPPLSVSVSLFESICKFGRLAALLDSVKIFLFGAGSTLDA